VDKVICDLALLYGEEKSSLKYHILTPTYRWKATKRNYVLLNWNCANT